MGLKHAVVEQSECSTKQSAEMLQHSHVVFKIEDKFRLYAPDCTIKSRPPTARQMQQHSPITARDLTEIQVFSLTNSPSPP